MTLFSPDLMELALDNIPAHNLGHYSTPYAERAKTDNSSCSDLLSFDSQETRKSTGALTDEEYKLPALRKPDFEEDIPDPIDFNEDYMQELKKNFNNSLKRLKCLAEGEEHIVDYCLKIYQENQSQGARTALEALIKEFSARVMEEKRVVNKLADIQNTRTLYTQCLSEQFRKNKEENNKLKNLSYIQYQRHSGKFKKFECLEHDDSEVYDWVVDINLLTDVGREGWKVEFSPKFYKSTESNIYDCSTVAKKDLKKASFKSDFDIGFGKEQGWEGAIVSVVGLYDKGKTFVLNNITNKNLPSGKKVNTKGLSFKRVDVDKGTKLVLLDTVGSYSPVKVVNELSVVEKEATEIFILDLVLELSDYFICVVNDFTSLDQRYLNRISRNLQNSPLKPFREVIVVHNLKDVTTREVLNHLWETQVTQIYGSGSIQRTKVAAVNPVTGILQEKEVIWFKTNYSRHVYLCNDDSDLGNEINPWTFSLLKYWLKAVFVPVNRSFSVIDSVITQATSKLSSYFKNNIILNVEDTPDPLVKLIKSGTPLQDSSNIIPQISIDNTGFVMAKPDSFLPQVDIVQGDKYIIYMDTPGLNRDEITISRQNSITIVKGLRKKPLLIEGNYLEKNERKYGEFTMTFKIPDNYNRKWEEITMRNGVLCIKYAKDEEEEITL